MRKLEIASALVSCAGVVAGAMVFFAHYFMGTLSIGSMGLVLGLIYGGAAIEAVPMFVDMARRTRVEKEVQPVSSLVLDRAREMVEQ